MWAKGFQSQNEKKKIQKVITCGYYKNKPHTIMHWFFFQNVLHDFEVKNSVSSKKRRELSNIQVVSIMSWLPVNSFAFSLDWKIHFNLDFVLKSFRCSKGDVSDVFCWQLYEMIPKNCRRKKLDDEVTGNWHRRNGEWIGMWQQWLVIFVFLFLLLRVSG